MQKFNKKEYIESIKSLHSADQADSIESLPFRITVINIKTHTKTFTLILLPIYVKKHVMIFAYDT